MNGIQFPDNVVAAAIVVFGAMIVSAMGYFFVRKSKPQDNDIAQVVAAAVSTAVGDITKPIAQALNNNTEAVTALQVTLAKQNGKLDNVLAQTTLLLQAQTTRHSRGES